MLKQIANYLKQRANRTVTKIIPWVQAHPRIEAAAKRLINQTPLFSQALQWLRRTSTPNEYTLYFTRENAPVTMMRTFRHLKEALDRAAEKRSNTDGRCG